MSISAPQHVLIVDDSPTDRRYLERVLESTDRYIHSAQSGQDAVQIIPKHDFALVILDVEMPGLDGYETAERIRALPAGRHVPIIFITGTDPDEDRIFKAYDSGAVDFLFKPVPKNLLRCKVNVFCEMNAQRLIIEAQLNEIQNKNEALRKQLDEIKVLRGLVPICVSCKKVRDDTGYWGAIETYLSAHSEAEFSHALCPGCTTEIYPDLDVSSVSGDNGD